ncbi:MAG: lytic transglycosylase domain-containing protein [Saprospiraceae bacterium]|nr:lytic transglycosylase domain-containing protein [Saprospiraceae bacterium]
MNKLMIVIRLLMITSFSLIIGQVDVLAHTNPVSEEGYEARVKHVSDKLIISRLDNLSSVIEINYTPEVGRRIREYTVNYRIAGERILGRVDRFFPLFEAELRKRNLPDELKYIAVVESNLDPTAASSAGAAGLWQFVTSTGKMHGLTINSYVDERKDPFKSTIAAMEYLSYLYEEFGDWTLAIAAYNCGPGGVRKAIRRGKSTNFWDIRFHLPNETQKYVPRIIAAMYLMQYYHAHDLVPQDVSEELTNVVEINDGKRHNFTKLAEDLGVSYRTIRKLNPQFKTNYIPKNKGQFTLVIPRTKYEKYLELYDRKALGDLLRERKEHEELRKQLNRMKRIMETRLEKPATLYSVIYHEIKSIHSVRPLFEIPEMMVAEELGD